MAKLRGPLFSLDAKGTFADRLTIRKRNKLHIILDYNKPGDRTPFESSPKQKDQRAIIGLVTIRWNCMTPAEKAPWNTLAKTSREPLTGYHLFLRTAQTDLYQYLGLAGYWSFNYNLGAIIPDLSGQANNSTLKPTYPSDCPTLDPGQNLKFGLACKFDGVDDYVEVPDSASLDITDALTITFWTKLPSIPIDERGFVVKWESFLVRTNPTGEAPRISAFIWIGGGAEPRVSLPTADEETNTWMYLTVTYDGEKWKLYKNGELKSEESRTGKIDITTNPVLIGSRDESTGFLKGLIDEVRIYNRALSAEEIRFHYNLLKPLFQ